MSPDITCEAQAVFLSFGSFSFFAYAISKKENEQIKKNVVYKFDKTLWETRHFTKSKILEKAVKQVQHEGKRHSEQSEESLSSF